MATYAYFIENTRDDNYRDNSRFFKLVRELQINDEDIFVDTEEIKEELDALLEKIESGDTIVLRSFMDLGDKGDMLQLVKELDEFGVLIRSADEPGLSGDDYCRAIYGVIKILRGYQEINRKNKLAEAQLAGRLGRPRLDAQTEKALRLYRTKEFSVDEITQMCSLSSSTLYRALREQEKTSS